MEIVVLAEPSHTPSTALVARRTVLIASLAGAATVAEWGFFTDRGSAVAFARLDTKPLFSSTVGFSSLSTRELALNHRDVVAGSRTLAQSVVRDELVARERRWLEALAPWTRSGPHAELIQAAYLDLFVLSVGLPAPVAGWSPSWRYVWPRDTAHIAVAFAQAGNVSGALECLRFLARVPRTEQGWFQARYTLDGRSTPDNRPAQFDGLGWVAWALREVSERVDWSAAGVARSDFLAEFAPLIAGICDDIVSAVSAAGGTAPVSPDYWEKREKTLTLGTIAPTLAGLTALIPLLDDLGDATRSRAAALASEQVTSSVLRDFAPYGYPRYAGGDTIDAAAAFLLPPYVRDFPDEAGVRSALTRAWEVLGQPAGGITPGQGWEPDGVSWTPETAVFALVDATSPDSTTRARARKTVEWLGANRTLSGSYPEKLLADGSPSAVAPLAWTAACVALAAYELR